MNKTLVAESLELVVTELGSIIMVWALRLTKTTDNMIFDKVDHGISFYFG